MKEDNDSLIQSLELIDQGDLTQWQGWSPKWKVEDIRKVLQPAGEPQPHLFNFKTLQRHTFPLAHQSQPLHVLANSNGEVVILRLEDAILTQSANDLEQLWGAPAIKKILPSNHKFAPCYLWVFPHRGLALYVMNAEKHDEFSLSAISLFVPATLEAYLRDLEGDERVRMWKD